MQTIKDFILNEAAGNNRAKAGSILEVELKGDGQFFWVDEKDYPGMNDWEIRASKNGRGFVVKVAKIKDLE